MEKTVEEVKKPSELLDELFPKQFSFHPDEVVRDMSFDLSNFYISGGTGGVEQLKSPVNPKVKYVNTLQVSIEGEAILRVKIPDHVLNSNSRLIENFVETKKAVLKSIAPYFHRFKIVECRLSMGLSGIVRDNSNGSYYTFTFKGVIPN